MSLTDVNRYNKYLFSPKDCHYTPASKTEIKDKEINPMLEVKTQYSKIKTKNH